jgi:hypothetical protein
MVPSRTIVLERLSAEAINVNDDNQTLAEMPSSLVTSSYRRTVTVRGGVSGNVLFRLQRMMLEVS